MSGRIARMGLWSGLGIVLIVTAYLLINTTFMLYDDEGYILLTNQNFLGGGRLYDDIFTQYGPWPYVYHLLIGLGLNEPLSHTVGRNLTALHWVLCALLVGAITRRLTGRLAAALVATLLAFGLLWQMVSEPSHPGSLIAVMIAASTLMAVHARFDGRWATLGSSLGLVSALLLLTKINIGMLFLTGVGAAALQLTAWPVRWQRPARILAVLGWLAIPWGLMGPRLADSWVLILALQFTLSAGGLLWISPVANQDRQIPPHTWLIALGTGVGTLLLILAIVFARGTTWSALLQTVLIDPMRHPTSFMIGFTWVPLVWPVAILCWLVTGWAGWELRQRGEIGPRTRQILIVMRLAAGITLISQIQSWPTLQGVGRFIVFCLPLLPVFLVPLHPRRKTEANSSRHLHLWVACLALPQVLHAYPVAGSQMGWGTFMLLPLFFAGLHEAMQSLAGSFTRIGHWVQRAGWSIMLLAAFAQLALLLHTGWGRYQTSKPLGLPGAELVRPGDTARLAMRILTLNAAVHADMLFSRPGMYSYNLWSHVPTPTAQNATHWFWLLDVKQQTDIIEALRQTPRTAVITSLALDDFLARIHVPMNGPLQSFITAHYRTLFSMEYLQFLVPLTSRAVPFGRIEVMVPAMDKPAPDFAALLQTNVVLDGKLAGVQLQQIRSPWAVHEHYTAQDSRIVLEPITPQGDPAGPAIELPHAESVRGLYRMSIYLPSWSGFAQTRGLALIGLDPAGNVVSESAF